MRDVKYTQDSGDDIRSAFRYNGLGAVLEEIDVIVAEVCGENDGCDWWWLLKMKDGKFRLATGGCDYTGWDCQSDASVDDPRDTWEEALLDAPDCDRYGRLIRKCLRGQVTGTQPFAVYTEEYPKEVSLSE